MSAVGRRHAEGRARVSSRGLTVAAVGAMFAAVASAAAAPSPSPPWPPPLVATIPLPDVRGRIDHLAVDVAGQRLFVAALGNDSVEVLDLRGGARTRRIAGLHEPQGVLFVAPRHTLYVTNGGSGECATFDTETFASGAAIALGADADNLRYDARDAMVVAGSGRGALNLIRAADGTLAGRIALPGHPEAFQLEEAGPRAFVNVPAVRQIAVVDCDRRTVVAVWPLTAAAANYPMALDEAGHRLFVGTRQPPRVEVYDTDRGSRVASLASVRDMDDLFFDAPRRRLYAIGGEGMVDVFAAADGDRWERLTQVATRPGARTGLWVPAWRRLYVALPRVGQQAAEIRAYDMAH